jgi:integrator complex subunit 6
VKSFVFNLYVYFYLFVLSVDKFTSLREQLNEFGGFVVGMMRGHCQKGKQSYRNPFDIPRRCLLDQVVRMRANFLQPALSHTKLIDDGKSFS